MVSSPTMVMDFMVTLISMGEAFGTAMDMLITIPTGDHLIVLTTIDEMIFAEIALTVLLIEDKRQRLGWEELRSMLALKETTTGHLLV